MNNIDFNIPEYQNFVTPDIAHHLCEIGLDYKSKFMWKVRDGYATLFTGLFDPDGYYMKSQDVIESVSPYETSFPAFQTSDIEKFLPNYTFERLNGKYAIMIDRIFDVSFVECDRMPDAFALIALKLFIKEPNYITKAVEMLSK